MTSKRTLRPEVYRALAEEIYRLDCTEFFMTFGDQDDDDVERAEAISKEICKSLVRRADRMESRRRFT